MKLRNYLISVLINDSFHLSCIAPLFRIILLKQKYRLHPKNNYHRQFTNDVVVLTSMCGG